MTRTDTGSSLPNNTFAGAVSTWGLQNGFGSRLGFRGTEDLGGGNYARFALEHRLGTVTGLSTAPTFWR